MEQITDIAQSKLKRLIEQIEHAEHEKAEVLSHIKDIYNTAKSDGFEPKIMRKIISMRKKRTEELEEEEILVDTYKRALGMDS